MKSQQKGDEEVATALNGSEGPHSGAAEPTLPPEVQERLGDELRKHYASLVAMPLPGRFLELLEQLAKSEDDGGKT